MSEFTNKLQRAGRRLRERINGNFDCKTNIIVLHEQRLLYFALPKVANSSLKALLTEAMTPYLSQDLRAVLREGRNLFHGKDVRRRMYEEKRLLCKHQVSRFEDYLSFAFVRNPWDRLVSCYVQKIEQKDLSGGANEKGTTGSLEKAGAFRRDMSFRDFARAVSEIPDSEAGRHFRSQYTFLCDRRGRLLPAHIGRFENLSDDLSSILGDRLGAIELPHLKKTARRNYRDYYDEATKFIVAERFRTDIELFHYSF